MIRMQDHDQVHRLGQHRVDDVFLGRHGVEHVQEVFRVGQIVARINERLADRVFVRPGGDRRHLGDQPEGADLAALGFVDVQGVVIERGQRADHAGHHRHGMRIAAETVVEIAQLLVQHGVAHDTQVEFLGLRRGWQFAVQQQVADFQEVGFFRQLLDRIAAIQQDAFVTVDVGDLAVAGCGGAVAWIEGEHAEVAVQLADVEDVRADAAGQQRQTGRLVRAVQGDGNRPFGRSAHVPGILAWGTVTATGPTGEDRDAGTMVPDRIMVLSG